jgi:hypothetical protein
MRLVSEPFGRSGLFIGGNAVVEEDAAGKVRPSAAGNMSVQLAQWHGKGSQASGRAPRLLLSSFLLMSIVLMLSFLMLLLLLL